jgi:hypothetical protein
MKVRILAALLVAGSIAAPYEAANAGALTNALRNKLGTAVFLGKVAKGNLTNGLRHAFHKGLDKVICFRTDCG